MIGPDQNSPGNLSMSNQPGTPRDDGEMGGNFLNPFQNESVSPYPHLQKLFKGPATHILAVGLKIIFTNFQNEH